MKNFKQWGHTLEFTAPAGGVTSGTPVLIGGVFVIPEISAAAGEPFTGLRVGVSTLDKTTGEAWAEGQAAFWDAANAKVSTDPTVGLPIGFVAVAALSADTTGDVALNGTSIAGELLTVRKRFTIAQVNAGATIVPALPGVKIRMVDAMAIAVGGAAGAVTTVDIIGTLTSSRKLVAFAQASLLQSAVLRAGGTGADVLADGASFTANDAGTAITIGKTGADVTTATHIDVQFTYTLE